MSRIAFNAVLLLLIGLLLFGIYLAIREGVVAVLWKGVHNNVVLWKKDGQALTLQDWRKVRRFADDALSWNSRDPQLLQTSAVLDGWGAWKYLAQPKYSAKLADAALDSYRNSIRARPLWPDSWLNLASLKHWRGQWDEEFQNAYKMAWRYGAWRKQVILQAAELGFDAWIKFTPENREIFYQALRRAALRDHAWLRRTAVAKNGLFVLCLALSNHPSTREYCATKGYAPP